MILPLSVVQGSHQYMPSMHNPGMGHSSMQGMYNSAPQAIPGHMHPHSRSYPVDLGMNHHPMMDQVTLAVWPFVNKLKRASMVKGMQPFSCAALATRNSMSERKPAWLTHHAICNGAPLRWAPIWISKQLLTLLQQAVGTSVYV